MKTNSTLLSGGLKEKASLFVILLLWVIVIIINILPFMDGSDDLMDFGSFYASGLKLVNGENPYDSNSEYIFEIIFPKVGAGGKMMNLNPPVSAMIFSFLSRFDPHQSLIVWEVFSAILYVIGISILTSLYRQNLSPLRFLWAFSLAGFWHTLVLGQIYILLFLFTTLGWSFIKKGRYILAGIAIGLLIAIKPNFILWPVFLLLAGYYTTVATSIVCSLIVSCIPIIFHGTGIYIQWLEASALHIETLAMPGNNSILGLTARFHNLEIGIALSVILVLVLLYISKSRPPKNRVDHEDVSALGIIASLLASPITWTGYTILLVPIFFSIKNWTPAVKASAVILSIPFAIVLQLFQRSYFNFVFFGWLYGWGILVMLGYSIYVIRQEYRQEEHKPGKTSIL